MEKPVRKFRKGASLQKLKNKRSPSISESKQTSPQVEDNPRASNQTINERRAKGFLERGWMRTRLIIELAKDEKTQRVLAKEFDCTQGAIASFKKRHLVEIEEAKGRLMDEFVSLWGAMKSARISEYEQDLRDCNALIKEEMERENADSEVISRHMRSKHRAIRSIAEELGQIPRSMDLKMDTKQLAYIIEGVDMDKV